MKVKQALIAVMGVGLVSGFIYLPTARAERVVSQGQTITVTAVVPELRMVVVDERGRITLMTSNTAHAVTPEVRLWSVDGPVVPLTEKIRLTYEALLELAPPDKVVTIRPTPQPLTEWLPDFTADASDTD